eukprot:TRINITY_DN8228_c0_g1_i1.p1 TRINITY_DN8228_c0_g1~~TRINITY_DN8228_c0_g1_i1.p1  ORF type:complete len:1105 (+),score=242.64 TRINITY_DN8228_c0_g1_i1:127-3441(+)
MRQKWEDHLGLQVYLPFLTLFIFFLLHGKGLGPGYWQTFTLNDNVMGQEFTLSDALRFTKFYPDVGDAGEYWEWVTGPLVGGWWTGEDDDSANSFIQYGNMPIGAMKIRQMRVAPSKCSSRVDILKNHFSSLDTTKAVLRLADFPYDCYSDWGPSAPIDKNPYVIKVTNTTTGLFDSANTKVYLDKSMLTPEARDLVGEAFFFRECSGINGLNASVTMVLEGKAATYGCSGHALIMPFSWTSAKANQAFAMLQEGVQVTYENQTFTLPWIDNQTRALSVEMFTFNQNLQLFSRLQYLVEVTAGGSFIPIYNNINFKLFQWSTDPFVIYFFMFLFFASLVFYFTNWCVDLWQHASEIMVDRRRKGVLARITSLFAAFASSFWTIFDFMNYVFFFTVWGLRFVSLGYGMTNTPVLQNDWFPDEYETVARSTQIISYLDSINGLLCVGRIFYFLRLNTRFNVLTKTIEVALFEIAGLLFIFLVLFLGFCLMGFTVFGHVVEDYRDMGNVIGILLRYLVGDFDYDQIREERRIFAPIFFALFTALCFFLLFNMFIAVLSDAFATVQQEKWKPALLHSLLKNTDDDAYEPLESQTGNPITNLAIVRELIYWGKTAMLAAQNLIRLDDKWKEEYPKLVQDSRNCNPRLFWRDKEQAIVQKKSCVPFVDKLNLCPISLEGFLIDGDDNAEEDLDAFQGFGGDFNVVMKTLVYEPSDKMEREKQETLLELLEVHYYWAHDIRGIAEVGYHDDYEDDERGEMLRKMMNDEEDDDAVSLDDSVEPSADEEEELREEQRLIRDARERRLEQHRIMKELEHYIVKITSNKKSLETVISRAATNALKSRMVRRKTVVRIEQGNFCKIRVHKLIAARYGRYLTQDEIETRQPVKKKVTLVNGGREDKVTVTQGWSEEKYLARARYLFDLDERKDCVVKDAMGNVVHLYCDEVVEGGVYTVEEGTGVAVDWRREWEESKDQMGRDEESWKCTIPDHIVMERLQTILDEKNGLLKFTVEDGLISGGSPIEDELRSIATCSESTINDYPEDHIEEIGNFSQLELIYEPTTVFREHLETLLIQMISKRLPSLMLETLTTQQLMTLLNVKVKRAETPLNAPTE